MDINNMRYFMTAAEYLNFTKAAQACYITQTAMSAAIAKMERELGVTLFHRSNKKVELTNAGKIFYRQTKELIRAYDEALRLVKNAALTPEQDLTILFPHLAEATLMTGTIQHFRHKNPHLKVTTQIISPERIRSRLIREDNAVAVCIMLPTLSYEESGLDIRPIASYAQRLFLARTHPLASRAQITMADIGEEPFALYAPAEMPPISEAITKLWREADAMPKTMVSYETISDLIGALLHEKKVTLMPSYYEKIVPEGIVSRPISGSVPIMTSVAGFVRKGDLAPGVTAFLETARARGKFAVFPHRSPVFPKKGDLPS